MKMTLTPADYQSGTWFRVRAELLRDLWAARAALETDLSDSDTVRCRERIRFVKALLHGDPKKDDWQIRDRALGPDMTKILAEAFPASPPEEEAGDLRPPADGPL